MGFVRRYNPSRRGAWKASSFVSLGELNKPIAVIVASKVPIDGTAIFEERVRPYIQTLAAIDDGSNSFDGQSQANAQTQTVFVIRDEGHVIGYNSFVVWGSYVYKVLTVKRHRGLNPFLEIATASYGLVSNCGFTLDETLVTSEAGEAQELEKDNLFWGD